MYFCGYFFKQTIAALLGFALQCATVLRGVEVFQIILHLRRYDLVLLLVFESCQVDRNFNWLVVFILHRGHRICGRLILIGESDAFTQRDILIFEDPLLLIKENVGFLC